MTQKRIKQDAHVNCGIESENFVDENDTEQPEVLVEKTQRKKQKHKKKAGFYYSFLTLVLLFCLAQVGFGAILNISKTIAYRNKIYTMEKVRQVAEDRNTGLKQDIKLFSSMSSLESIARNNLKMAGEDEVLVIINNEQAEKTSNVKSKKKHKK